MKKFTALIVSVVLLICLVGCNKQDVVLNETKTYEITSEIHSLDVQINAADFKIVSADEFSVESNLKYLSVSEKNGVLKIVDEAKSNSNYSDAALTLYVPNGVVFDDVDIETGAAKMTVDTLSASSVELKLGAGDVRFESLNASAEVDIKGGAGQITIVSGTLNDLSLEMGMGELNLTAAVFGDSDLKFGVGESNVALIGSKDDYKVDIEKGLGSITVDGKTVTDYGSSGNGQNHIEIEGGIGAINLKFQEK
ncbi:MAG: DUF4097 family beta strand repeat protein [Bacteroides sp.]|nr:DUF4097 family beta strand repeat protein [Prevotella sp.]MBO5507290.1 DUF4097 family beta strand repeat protein [Bacteroides sp.]